MARQPQNPTPPNPQPQQPIDTGGQTTSVPAAPVANAPGNPSGQTDAAGNPPGRYNAQQATGAASTTPNEQPTAGRQQQNPNVGNKAQTQPAQPPAAPTVAKNADQSTGRAAQTANRGAPSQPLQRTARIRPAQGALMTDDGGPPGVFRSFDLFTLISDLRSVSVDITERNWSQLCIDAGKMLEHLGAAIAGEFVPVSGAMLDDADNPQEALANARKEFDAAASEFDKAKAFGFQAIHQLPQEGWHVAGGPTTGAAPGMGTPATVGLAINPQWIHLALEIGGIVVDAIRQYLNKPNG
jgi:hypothetical protein